MRCSTRDAVVGAALAVMVGTDAADVAAAQARGRLAVTVRVVDRCRTTSTTNAVTQACSGRAAFAVKAETPENRPTPFAATGASGGGSRAVTADTAYLTVIY